MSRHPALERPVGAVMLRRAEVERRASSLVQVARARLSQRAERLSRARLALESRHPRAQLSRMRVQADALAQALSRAQAARLSASAARIRSLGARLDSVGPARVLARGYSITVGPDGNPVRDASALAPGDSLRSIFARGAARSSVSHVDTAGGESDQADAQGASPSDH